jgi:hypothetical protein
MILNYDAHYKARDATPAQLMVDIDFLRKEKRFPEIEQAIQAYLRYHSKKAEPWMYLLLATAFEVDGRGDAKVREAVGWAGFLARRSGDPFTMIEVADVMLLRDAYEIALPGGREPVSAGQLLDLAWEKAPYRAEPILLSILLAEETEDAERLITSVERLLALGWPGMDETWRTEAGKKVEALADKLQAAGKAEQASSLRDRLAKALQRDLFVRLTWAGDAGLDLVVDEPLGATAEVLAPRTVFGGSIVKSGRGKHPESVYVCPRGFDGEYKIRVESLYNSKEDPAKEVTLEVITHEGTPEERRRTFPVDLAKGEPVAIRLEGGHRTEVLPFSAPTRLVVVPEALRSPGASSPGQGEAVTVPPPGAAEAADLLRSGGGAAPRRGTIQVNPEGGTRKKP